MISLLQLDPDLPVLWRSPDSLQVGVSPPVARSDGLDSRHLPVLAALHAGISISGLDAIASSAGLSTEETKSFLDDLRPALGTQSLRSLPRLGITGSTQHAADFTRVLSQLGYPLDVEAPDEAILLAHYVLSPTSYHPHLAHDRPHTPVRFSDQAVLIGPRVTPGEGPCLRCVWDRESRAEPALVALASQLAVLQAASDTPQLHRLAAWHTLGLITSPAPGLSVRLDRYTHMVTTHVEEASDSCLCRGLGSPTTR
jgi:hypothetical protein